MIVRIVTRGYVSSRNVVDLLQEEMLQVDLLQPEMLQVDLLQAEMLQVDLFQAELLPVDLLTCSTKIEILCVKLQRQCKKKICL